MTKPRPIVLLFSVDGMRPDGMQQAHTPYLDALMAEGASTMVAQTVMPSVTLPCHTSMHRGVDVPRHGITTNTFMPLARPVPSVFDVAHDNHLRTGFFLNWPELRDLCSPESLDICVSFGESHLAEGDRHVAEAAVQFGHDLDFAFVYLGYTDTSGHESDWMSPAYLKAIGEADRCIGYVRKGLEITGRPIISLVMSDHGGHGRSHGTDMPEDMTIPWILHGPGIQSGYNIEGPVKIFDTAPTLAHILGIPAARQWEGQVIEEALIG